MGGLAIYLTTFAVLLLAVGGLAIGLLQRKPLQGSCGGIANFTGERCAVCGAGEDDACRKAP